MSYCSGYYPARYNSETESARSAIAYLSDYLDVAAIDFGPLAHKSVRARICAAKNNLGRNANLFELSVGVDQYKGFVISVIDAIKNTVSFIFTQ